MFEYLFPINSKRRLLAVFALTFLRHPLRFLALLKSDNIHNFFYYIRTVGPFVIEKSLARSLSGEPDDAPVVCRLLEKLALARSDNARASCLKHPPVDIIIPVYNSAELLKVCLDSVLSHSENCRVVVIDDDSTDRAIPGLLSSFEGDHSRGVSITVIRNEENVGFIRSINLGLAESTSHAVILNSDTEVPAGWLSRLLAPIVEDAAVATVTPMSNSAALCSFPEADVDNLLFKGLDVGVIDSYFAHYGSNNPVVAPTGVGFCMAISRRALDVVGSFDADTFGRGYGEENDFCMRAAAAGLKNVIVTNLFVAHHHGGTFTSIEKQALLTRNMKLLLQRHPGYLAAVDEFSRRNPLQEVRDVVSALMDAGSRSRRHAVAMVDHAMGGGANQYSRCLIEQLSSAGCDTLHLQMQPREQLLKIVFHGETVSREFKLAAEPPGLVSGLCRVFGVNVMVVNDLVGWSDPLAVMEEISGAGIPYLLMLHNYFVICPKWFLIDSRGSFCALPDESSICRDCLAGDSLTAFHGIYGGRNFDLRQWRLAAAALMAKAEAVICFSQASERLVSKVFSGQGRLMVAEHAIPERELFRWRHRTFPGGDLSVAVIGAMEQFKGIRLIEELVDSASFRSMPVQLTVFGETTRYPDGYAGAGGRFRVTGRYDRRQLPDLLEQYGVHLVLIPSICPETFSYSTSEALLMGYPVLCFDLGAQAERVKGRGCGIVMERISAAAIAAELQAVLSHPETVGALSLKTRDYVPPSMEEHFRIILDKLDIGGIHGPL